MICDLCKMDVSSTELMNGYWICDDDVFRIGHPEEMSEDFQFQRERGSLSEHEIKVLTDIGVFDCQVNQ